MANQGLTDEPPQPAAHELSVEAVRVACLGQQRLRLLPVGVLGRGVPAGRLHKAGVRPRGVRVEHAGHLPEAAERHLDEFRAVKPEVYGLPDPYVLQRPLAQRVEGERPEAGLRHLQDRHPFGAEGGKDGCFTLRGELEAGTPGRGVQPSRSKSGIHAGRVGRDVEVDAVQVGELVPVLVCLVVLVEPAHLRNAAGPVLLEVERAERDESYVQR